MRTIHKYPVDLDALDFDNVATIPMKKGASVIHVDVQDDVLCIWALVDDEVEMEDRKILVVGTGHPIPESMLSFYYLGSALLIDGRIVLHLFEDMGMFTEAPKPDMSQEIIP